MAIGALEILGLHLCKLGFCSPILDKLTLKIVNKPMKLENWKCICFQVGLENAPSGI